MKKTLFLVLCFFMVTQINARNARLGLKGGLYFSTLPSEIIADINNASLIALKDRNTGYHFGVLGSFVFPGFFLQPELLIVSTGNYMQVDHEDVVDTEEFFTQNFQHLAMPVLLGLKIGPLKLGAGPVFSVLLNQKNDSTSFRDLNIELSRATVGYQIGGGLHLGSLLLEARYEANLTKFGDGVSVGGHSFDFDMRPRQLILSIGLLF